jgi:hypothetical protein
MATTAIDPAGRLETEKKFPGIEQSYFSVTPEIPVEAARALAEDCGTLFCVLQHEHTGTELGDAFDLAGLVLDMFDGYPIDPITYARVVELYAKLGGTFQSSVCGNLDQIKRGAYAAE